MVLRVARSCHDEDVWFDGVFDIFVESDDGFIGRARTLDKGIVDFFKSSGDEVFFVIVAKIEILHFESVVIAIAVAFGVFDGFAVFFGQWNGSIFCKFSVHSSASLFALFAFTDVVVCIGIGSGWIGLGSRLGSGCWGGLFCIVGGWCLCDIALSLDLRVVVKLWFVDFLGTATQSRNGKDQESECHPLFHRLNPSV